MHQWARTTFAALAHDDFRVIWIGTGLSFLAFTMAYIAQSIVAYDLTGRNESVGIVALGQGAALLIVAPFSGVMADRFPKRMLVMVAQAMLAGLLFASALLLVTDQMTILLLTGTTFAMGIFFPMIGTARQAWVGEMLPPPMLPNGLALMQVAQTQARVFGPFLAGALIAIPFIGATGAFIAMGLIVAFVAVTTWKLPGGRTGTKGGRSPLRELWLGIQHIGGRPRLALLVSTWLAVVGAGFSFQVILPGLLENELGRSSSDLGWLMGVSGVTGLIGTVAAAGMVGGGRGWSLMFGGAALFALGLLLVALAPNFWLTLIAMAPLGMGMSLFQMVSVALVIQESAAPFYGRVMGIVILGWGLQGIFSLPFGMLGDAAGERATLIVMGLAVTGVCAATWIAYQTIRGAGSPAAEPLPGTGPTEP